MKKQRIIKRKEIVFVLISVIFFVFKFVNIIPRISDENLYFYAADLLNRGILPYRDFPMVHMPGQILLYVSLMRIFGFHLTLFKLIPVLFSIGSAWILYLLFKERGKWEGGLIAGVLFLFSSLLLSATDASVGVHEATFFLVLAWYLLIKKKAFWGGVAFFTGLIFRQYILAAGMGIAAYRFWKHEKRGPVVLLAVGLGFYLLLSIVLYAAFGEDFLTPVWRYHFFKLAIPTIGLTLADFLRNDKFLVLFALAGMIIFVRRGIQEGWLFFKKEKNKNGCVQLGFESMFAAILQFGFLRGFFGSFLIYYVTLLPFLSVMASLVFSVFVPKRSRDKAYYLVIGLAILNSLIYKRNFAGRYSYADLDRIVADVQELADPDEKIFGQALVTPLIAILSGRDIKDWQIDTNTQRYLSGYLKAEEATQLATGSAVFIQTINYDVNTGEVRNADPPFVSSSVVIQSCEPYGRYPIDQGFGINSLVLWDCRD